MKSISSLRRTCLVLAAILLVSFSTRAQVIAPPVVSIAATVAETTEPSPTIRIRPGEFTLTRTGRTNEALLLKLEFSGTATSGRDYQALAAALTLPAGVTSASIQVFPVDDAVVESDETVIATLAAPSANARTNYTVDAQRKRATVVIHDSDEAPFPPVVRIEATRRIAEETSYPYRRIAFRGVFTLSRTGPTNDALRVFVHYSGSATPGADYPALPLLVSIPAGAASTELIVEPIVDNVPEGIETLVATLSQCPPATVPPLGIPCFGGFEIDPAGAQATVFLRDDGATQASLVITNPRDGAIFNVGDSITIEAVAIDLEGYLSRVEFWDGTNRIGVSEIVFIRAPDPGTPIHHSFEWLGAAPSAHALTARVTGADGSVLSSSPVQIRVGPVVERVILAIEATDAQAVEPGANAPADPAVFTIRRTAGPRDVDVTVFYSVSGTASNGVDYAPLGGRVILPGGAENVRLVVTPLADSASEGSETVVVRLESPVCIAIFPPPPECYLIGQNALARAVIEDREVRETNQAPRVVITQPDNGDQFLKDADIEITAETRDADGYVRRMSFFANGRKIGESNIEFIRAPDPGQTQTFNFVWRHATPGAHQLTAQATDDRGTIGKSAPVEIEVARAEPLPIVTVEARDAWAVEPDSNTNLNTATFRIRRSGPTNEPLVVAYTMDGMAKNGADYVSLSGLTIIPAASRSAIVPVVPLADALREGKESVVLRLEEPAAPGPNVRMINPYRVGRPGRAAVVISDKLPTPSLEGPRCVPLPGRLLHLCFAAESGGTFRVEASADTRHWETLCVTTSRDGAVQFIDDEAEDHPCRFYRVTPEPVADNED